jgi:RNA polymerase sigma factor (sigma-70 family)
MDALLTHDADTLIHLLMAEQNQGISKAIARERGRLGRFIRQRVSDAGDAEDILQEVFSELVEAYRLPEPIEQVGAWLFRVARNRIVDRFRKRREEPLPYSQLDAEGFEAEGELWLEQTLPSPDAGPEAAYMRGVLLKAVSQALEELPEDVREVFIAHELDGLSFKEMAAQSGVNLNTLLGWKRQAVLHLRKRLQTLYDELYE